MSEGCPKKFPKFGDPKSSIGRKGVIVAVQKKMSVIGLKFSSCCNSSSKLGMKNECCSSGFHHGVHIIIQCQGTIRLDGIRSNRKLSGKKYKTSLRILLSLLWVVRILRGILKVYHTRLQILAVGWDVSISALCAVLLLLLHWHHVRRICCAHVKH